MTHGESDPFTGAPRSSGQFPPHLATSASEPQALPATSTGHDAASFDAGQDCGMRVAACLARLSALELIDRSSWWNRRARRLAADALVAHAEELESAADATSAEAGGRWAPFTRSVMAPKARSRPARSRIVLRRAPAP